MQSWALSGFWPLQSFQTTDDFAGGGAPPITPRRTSAGSGSFGKRVPAAGHQAARRRSARMARRSSASPSVATALGPPIQVQRKALPRSLLAVPELACARADKFPGPSSPSRESASSISSRGAKPAMALLRFSTPSAWVRSGPPCRVRSEADRRPPIPCARKRGSSSSTWRSGYPRSPHRASPFRVFPPLRSVPVARSMPSWGCPRRVHRGSGAPSRPCSLCGVPCEPWQARWVLSWGSPL